jgi:acyl-coenzyme A thioesterase PaaI-like protein
MQSEQLSNHLGSVHAGAIFTLGETASGAAMIGAFAQMATMIRPVATSAKISYLKLGRGAIKALARTDASGTDLRHQLHANGLATFEVNVDVQDARDRVIAQVIVSWRVTMPKRRSD